MLSAFDTRRLRAKLSRLLNRRTKCRQAFDDSLKRRQRLVTRDKEVEPGLDPAKGAGRLRHLSKADLSEEEIWCDDNIRDNRAGLKIGCRKSQQLQRAADNGVEVGHERAKAAAQYPPFGIFAPQQRYLLAVFAQTGQREPKIGLVALSRELQLNERFADQMGQPRANQRINQSDPERQSRDGEVGARNGEVDRYRPEDDREGDECRHRRQQADRVGVGQVEKIADILSYPLVGIIRRLAEQRRTIEVALIEP